MATKSVKKVAKKAVKKGVKRNGGGTWNTKELMEIKKTLDDVLTGKRNGAVFVIAENTDKESAEVSGGVRGMNRMNVIGHVFNAIDIPQSAVLGVMMASKGLGGL